MNKSGQIKSNCARNMEKSLFSLSFLKFLDKDQTTTLAVESFYFGQTSNNLLCIFLMNHFLQLRLQFGVLNFLLPNTVPVLSYVVFFNFVYVVLSVS